MGRSRLGGQDASTLQGSHLLGHVSGPNFNRGAANTLPQGRCCRHGESNKERSMAKEPKTLDNLFHDTLKDIYYAEKKILATLPKMAKAAQNDELTAAFEKHRVETEGHVGR